MCILKLLYCVPQAVDLKKYITIIPSEFLGKTIFAEVFKVIYKLYLQKRLLMLGSQGFSNFGEFVEPPKFKPHGFAGVAIGLFSKCCLDTAAGALAPSAVL